MMTPRIRLLFLFAFSTFVLIRPEGCPSNCSCRKEHHHCCILIDEKYPCSAYNISHNQDQTIGYHHPPLTTKCKSIVKSLVVEINSPEWPSHNTLNGACLDLRKLKLTGNNNEKISRGDFHYSNVELTSNDIDSYLGNMNETSKVNLVTFSLEGTLFHTLQDGLLHRLKFINVENVFINMNVYLQSLPLGCFLGLDRLRVLNLAKNSLVNVELTDWGVHGEDLQIVNLSNNAINQLKSDTFDNFPMIEEINLDNNRLTSLDARVFERLTNLKVLSLRGNNLVLSSLTGILTDPGPKQLLLSDNPLLESHSPWWLTKGCPKKTEIIHLDNIAIDFSKLLIDNETRIIDVKRCPSLREVHFKENKNLNCLPRSWLGNEITSLSFILQVLPKSLEYCPSDDALMMLADNASKEATLALDLNGSLKGINQTLGDYSSSDSFNRSMILIVMLSMFIFVVLLTLFASFITCYKRQKQQAALKTHFYSENNDICYPYHIEHGGTRASLFAINGKTTATASYVYCPSIEGSQQMLNSLPKSPMINTGSVYQNSLYYQKHQNTFIRDPDVDSLNCNDSGISNSGKPSNNSSSTKPDVQVLPSSGTSKYHVPVRLIPGSINAVNGATTTTFQNVYYQHQTCSPQRKVIDANLSSSLLSLNGYRSQSPSSNSLMVSSRNLKACDFFVTSNSPVGVNTTAPMLTHAPTASTFNASVCLPKKFAHLEMSNNAINDGNNIMYNKITQGQGNFQNSMAFSNLFANNNEQF